MRKLLTVFMMVGVIAIALPASADVIFDNGAPDLGESWWSEVGDNYQEADDFVLQAGATFLTDVHWWGVYASDQSPQTDSFTIRLFADDGGAPDTTPFYEVSGIDGGRVSTGTYEDGTFEIYSYWADIAPINLASNTTYWISILNDTANDTNDNWYWTTSDSTSGNGAQRFGDGGAWSDVGDEFAFYLTGRTVVPEPASMTLLGLGLAGLVARRRKKA